MLLTFNKDFEMKRIIAIILFLTLSLFSLTLNEIPKEIKLLNDGGGLTDGMEWNSSGLKGKLNLLLYLDPDKKDDIDNFMNEFNHKNYDNSKLGITSILNLKATWLPNFAIEEKLKSQQEKFKNIIYVKDKSKLLVDKWDLADNSVNILLFDKNGKLIYQHNGKFTKDEQKQLFHFIEEKLK